MIKKKIVSLIVLVLCGLVATAAVNEAQVKQKISQMASAIRTMQCDFVQTKHLKMLNDNVVSRGRMYYQQSSHLRWEYTSPYTYTFVYNGSKVMIKNARRNDVIDANKNKVFKEIGNVMMSSVMGNCLNDTRSFKTTIAETSTEWVASLVPQRKEMKQMFRLIKLHINRQRAMVTSVELIERNGDRTVIELRNVKTNVNIPASTFAVS